MFIFSLLIIVLFIVAAILKFVFRLTFKIVGSTFFIGLLIVGFIASRLGII